MASPLVNKSVRLSQEQIAALADEAARDRREFSSLVRIAVDDLIAARRNLRAVEPAEVAS